MAAAATTMLRRPAPSQRPCCATAKPEAAAACRGTAAGEDTSCDRAAVPARRLNGVAAADAVGRPLQLAIICDALEHLLRARRCQFQVFLLEYAGWTTAHACVAMQTQPVGHLAAAIEQLSAEEGACRRA